MKFQSHVPNFMHSDPAVPKSEFSSIEDLLENKWIKGWNIPQKEDFKYCWSSNEGKWSKACLMCEWIEAGKRRWCVLGYMDEIPKKLPEWKAP